MGTASIVSRRNTCCRLGGRPLADRVATVGGGGSSPLLPASQQQQQHQGSPAKRATSIAVPSDGEALIDLEEDTLREPQRLTPLVTAGRACYFLSGLTQI